MDLHIKQISEVDVLKYAKEGDVAIDLRASGRWKVNLDTKPQEIDKEAYVLQPQERILILTGIAVQLPKGFWGNVRDRSSMALKGLTTAGGVIDESYRGEIGVVIQNLSAIPHTLTKNQRIAQMIIAPFVRANINYVDTLDDTDRGDGGFGHTGMY